MSGHFPISTATVTRDLGAGIAKPSILVNIIFCSRFITKDTVVAFENCIETVEGVQCFFACRLLWRLIILHVISVYTIAVFGGVQGKRGISCKVHGVIGARYAPPI